MFRHTIFNGLLQQPALLILIGAFTVLMALMIPAYFRAYRPKPNSTEWIGRLDRRSFRPLSVNPLTPADIAWALIAMLCAAFIWLVYCILRRNVALMLSPLRFTLMHLHNTIPIALTAVSLYLLLRLMSGKPLPAILASIIGSVSILSQPKGIALFSLSLLFLYLWICAPVDGSLLLKGLWFLLSAAAYGLAMVFTPPLLWAAPFYLGVYITVQVIRWKHGERGKRGKRLALSLVFAVLLLLAGFVTVWLAYNVRRHRGSPIDLLRSFAFYKNMLPGPLARLSALTARPSYWDVLLFQDVFCFIAGVLAVIPLLHGLIKQRDTRCLFLLLLLPCLILAWYFSACYALVPAFALIIGWCWCYLVQRGRPLYTVGFAMTYLLFLFAELYFH